MNVERILLIATLFCSTCLPVAAQRDATYDYSVVSQVRIDLRDLGYPPLDVIPSGESAIRALAVAPDGKVYGATSGDRSHLFVLEPQHGYVVPLGRLPDKTVHHALAVGANGDVYIGGALAVDNNGEGYGKYAGGHLLKYAPKGGRTSIQIEAVCPVEDLGIPVQGQGIYALTIDRKLGVIYGLTYPEGDFFSYNTATKAFKTHGQVAKTKIAGEKFENEKNIGRALVSGPGRRRIHQWRRQVHPLPRQDPGTGRVESVGTHGARARNLQPRRRLGPGWKRQPLRRRLGGLSVPPGSRPDARGQPGQAAE